MFVRLFLLQKRLLKKYSFLVMLCLAPLFAAGINGLAKEQSGIATIALCVPEEDPVAGEVADRLLAGEGVFCYLSCEEEAEARALVESGEADAAWIFSGDMEEEMQKLAEKRRVRPLVTVVERQDSVSLTLGREILSGAIYPAFSYAVYESYVRKDLGLEEITEERLRQTYESVAVEGSLFQMVYPDGTPGENEDFTYVQAPLRGILAIWFTFVGFSATLVFMQDESRGVYGRIPVAKRLFVSYGACAVFLVDAGVVLLLACRLAGVFTDWKREVISCVVFACCVLAFVNLLRLLCCTPQRMGMLLLPLGAVMLALCPVFLNLQYFRAGKMLLPPWYYLQSIHNTRYLYEMAVYTAVLILISALVQRLQNRAG
ncbi:MAG: ABC transporter permease [Lachnospiraceae bacterium]|nr:ABC transporter permease [Lachnospiraceae bacterium]